MAAEAALEARAATLAKIGRDARADTTRAGTG